MKTRFKSGNLTEERRAFLKQSGAMAAMSAFGLSFFTACTKDVAEPDMPDEDENMEEPDVEAITVTDNAVTIQLDLVEALGSSGGWILIQDANLLVVNVGGTYSALTSVCTHQGCASSWEYDNEVFTCTCHDSKFSTAGEVLQGPAVQPLTVFNTTLANGVLTVSI